MPLMTQIERNGADLKINWGQFHIAAMTLAAALECDDPMWEPIQQEVNGFDENKPIGISPSDVFQLVTYSVIAATPLNDGPYTLENDYTFLDPSDGEVFDLHAGDILKVWRT